MKYLKIALVVLVFGVVGLLVYKYFNKKKDGATAVNLPPLSTATPPISSGLASLDSGEGKAAIERRISEVLKSSKATEIEFETRTGIDILKGVSDGKKAYYNQNISRPPISSANGVPLSVSDSVKNALLAFTQIDGAQGKSTAENLLQANQNLFSVSGTCFIGNPELGNVQDFIQQVVCQGGVDCGKNYKNMFKSSVIVPGAQKAANDQKQIATNWLNAINLFEENVRQFSIGDLRANGWKFFGLDQSL